MYDIIVPLFNRSVTPDTREIYLEQFRKASVSRIFLAIFGYGNDAEEDKATAACLKENIEYFKKHGIEAGVWTGNTIGHGMALSVEADNVADISKYKKMVNVAGQEQEFVCCPLDESFRKRIAQHVSILATSTASLVLLDDDYRMSQHGPEPCCACDLHMARIRELCGEDIRREDLKELVFSGKPNKYRQAWLTAQRESLELLARDIRESVDKVAPDTRVGICTAHALWGIDGTDPIALAKILAGPKTVPFLRTHGAPYWVVTRKGPLPSVIEQARHFAYLCKDSGVEIVSEGDTYPRPRYIVPSSLLEMFDAAIRIDNGHNGILKYMVDYNASVGFETSYLRSHERNLSMMEQISEMFADKEALGVNVSCRRELFDQADLEMGVSGLYPYPTAGAMMSFNGISSVYGEGGICNAVFGEEARHIDIDKIKKGAILDGIAAQILTDRGVDVGLEGRTAFASKRVSFLTDPEAKEKALIDPPHIRYAEVKLSPTAIPVSKAYFGDEIKTIAYTFENSSGARFLVYCFDAMALPRNTGLYRGYLQQSVLKNGIEWITGRKLPAFIEKCPEVYVMCKGSDGRMAVALFNLFADAIDEPVITLDKEYSEIRFINCSGRLDGNRVVLDTPVYAYTLAAFEVW